MYIFKVIFLPPNTKIFQKFSIWCCQYFINNKLYHVFHPLSSPSSFPNLLYPSSQFLTYFYPFKGLSSSTTPKIFNSQIMVLLLFFFCLHFSLIKALLCIQRWFAFHLPQSQYLMLFPTHNYGVGRQLDHLFAIHHHKIQEALLNSFYLRLSIILQTTILSHLDHI